MLLRRVIGPAVLVASVATTLGAVPRQRGIVDGAAEHGTVVRFQAVVQEYLRTHVVERSLDLDKLCLPEDIYAPAAAAVALDVHPAPREGDIFSADVVGVFRRRMTAGLRGGERDETADQASVVVVGAPLEPAPNRRSATVLASLPPLPDALAYRLVGRDLALIDLRANVVADVLREWRLP